MLFADGQAVLASSEAIFKLNFILKQYNLTISTSKTKVRGFIREEPVRTKILIGDEILFSITWN